MSKKNPLRDVLARTCTDREFRNEFLRDPAGVLKRAGIGVPPGKTIKVLEDSDAEMFVVLPTNLDDQPANWEHQERPPPGEERTAARLVMRWDDNGLSLGGRIDGQSAVALREELERANGNLLIDFRDVEFMSSAGIAVLLATQKRLTQTGRELYLCGVPPAVGNVLALTGVDAVLNLVSATDEVNLRDYGWGVQLGLGAAGKRPEAKLVITRRETGREEFPLADNVLLGSAPDADIMIPNRLASKRHARILYRDSAYFIEDLDSSTGTLLNGRRVENAQLYHLDTVLLGSQEATFLLEGGGPRRERRPRFDSSRTEVLGTLAVDGPMADGMDGEDSAVAASLSFRLDVLREVSRASCGALDVGNLVQGILAQLLEVFPQAAHAHALLNGLADGGGDLVLSSVADGRPPAATGMSQALLDIATREEKAVLAADLCSDGAPAVERSGPGRGPRAMMCSPLAIGDKVLGAIQVDSAGADRPFTMDDLQVLAIVAGQVAAAADNARLHREVVAQQRLAAIGQAVSSVAHCIKNVINGVQGGAYIVDIGIKKQSQERIAQGWAMVKRNNDFMLSLVKDMLAYSRKSAPVPEPTDVAQILEETLLMIEELAASRQIRTELTAAGGMPKLNVDQTGLKRVVLNLLTNAVEACTGGGRVRLSAGIDEAANAVTISVEDDGPGIPPDVRERLFEPFYTTKGSHGTGLGLALVRKVVDEHRGGIEVESEPGHGTVFRLSFPLGADAPESAN